MALRSHYLPFIGYLLVPGVNSHIGNISALKAAGQTGLCVCSSAHIITQRTQTHRQKLKTACAETHVYWAGSGHAGTLSRQIRYPICSLTQSAQNGLKKGAEGVRPRRELLGMVFTLFCVPHNSNLTPFGKRKALWLRGPTLQKAERVAASTALGSPRQSTQERRLRASPSP